MTETFIMIKPDATERRLVGEILRDLEAVGLKVKAITLRTLKTWEAEALYREHKDKAHFDDLVKYTCSGSVALIWMAHDSEDAVKLARATIGATKPEDRQPGTIRAKWAQSMRRNSIHGSDSPEAAEREIQLFFRPKLMPLPLTEEDKALLATLPTDED